MSTPTNPLELALAVGACQLLDAEKAVPIVQAYVAKAIADGVAAALATRKPFSVRRFIDPAFRDKLKIWFHVQLWYKKGVVPLSASGGDKAGIPGYSSNDPATIQRQLDLLEALDADGVVCNWYGPWDAYQDSAFAEWVHQCGLRGKLVVIDIDKGAAKKGPHKVNVAGDPDCTANFIDAALYAKGTYGKLTGFHKDRWLEFGCHNTGSGVPLVDFAKVKAATGIDFLHDGSGYTWIHNPDGAAGIARDYVKHAAEVKIGSIAHKFFDGNPKDLNKQMWDITKDVRIMNRFGTEQNFWGCIDALNAALRNGLALEAVQFATLNDYTEDTALEGWLGPFAGIRIAS